MASEVANNFRLLLAGGEVDFNTDTFKIILMQDGFSFNEDSHALYSDVSGSELASGGGYTTGGNTLSSVAVVQDNVNDRVAITWANTSWIASGADVGPICGAIIYDDTITDDPIVGFIDFETAYTQADGGEATIANITVYV